MTSKLCGGCHQWGANPPMNAAGDFCLICDRTRDEIVQAHGVVSPCTEIEQFLSLRHLILARWESDIRTGETNHLVDCIATARVVALDLKAHHLADELLFLLELFCDQRKVWWQP